MKLRTESWKINRILARALEMEKYGQNFFSLLEELADEPESRKIFGRLAAEEENHYYLLKEELRQRGGEVDEETDFDPDRFFNRDIAGVLREGPAPVLRYAIRVEQRVIDFYSESINRVYDSGVKKFLSNLVEIEQSHKRILKKNLARMQM